MATEEKLQERVDACEDKRIKLVIGDVWKTLKSQKGWDRKFILFDLDFCKTAYTLKHFHGLIPNLNWLARSKLPRQSGFFISMTVCRRRDPSSDYLDISSETSQIFAKHGWSLTSLYAKSYREGGSKGAQMFTILFYFKWNDSKAPR